MKTFFIALGCGLLLLASWQWGCGAKVRVEPSPRAIKTVSYSLDCWSNGIKYLVQYDQCTTEHNCLDGVAGCCDRNELACNRPSCQGEQCVYALNEFQGCSCRPGTCANATTICSCTNDIVNGQPTTIKTGWAECPEDFPICDAAEQRCVCPRGASKCLGDSALAICEDGDWKVSNCTQAGATCNDGRCGCSSKAGDSCGSCKGVLQCDGRTCSKPTPPDFGHSCGTCGTWDCDHNCIESIPDDYKKACGTCGTRDCKSNCIEAPPTDYGKYCNCGGSIDCRGECSAKACDPTQTCVQGVCRTCSNGDTRCEQGVMKRCDNWTWTSVGQCEDGFAFSYSGPLPGWNCAQIAEVADPHGWNDNYLCTQANYGFAWSSSTAYAGMKCIKVYEGCEPPEHTWNDNYLCWSSSARLQLSWSEAGPISGTKCVNWNEPADPDCWADNYLCWTIPSPLPRCDEETCHGSCGPQRIRECQGNRCVCVNPHLQQR